MISTNANITPEIPKFNCEVLEQTNKRWRVKFDSADDAVQAVTAFWNALGSETFKYVFSRQIDKLSHLGDREKDLRTGGEYSGTWDGERDFSINVTFRSDIGEISAEAFAWMEKAFL